MIIKSENDLITTRQETRKGFIEFALEKNRRALPFIEEAKAFKFIASQAKVPSELLNMHDIELPLLTAAGISDKALKYFDDAAKKAAIDELIKNFLEPVGDEFIDELIYRFLLIKGDALGGSMRNIIGALAQKKLIRYLLSVLKIKNIHAYWLSSHNKSWSALPDDDYGIEDKLKALSWEIKDKFRTFAFNLTIPRIGNNIDLCLFQCESGNILSLELVNDFDAPIMLGELKGGIDPAGADEHWKTANSALQRIKKAYAGRDTQIKTSFIGAAIEKNMAKEIYIQLINNELNYAINLTKEKQVYAYCEWLLKI